MSEFTEQSNNPADIKKMIEEKNKRNQNPSPENSNQAEETDYTKKLASSAQKEAQLDQKKKAQAETGESDKNKALFIKSESDFTEGDESYTKKNGRRQNLKHRVVKNDRNTENNYRQKAGQTYTLKKRKNNQSGGGLEAEITDYDQYQDLRKKYIADHSGDLSKEIILQNKTQKGQSGNSVIVDKLDRVGFFDNAQEYKNRIINASDDDFVSFVTAKVHEKSKLNKREIERLKKIDPQSELLQKDGLLDKQNRSNKSALKSENTSRASWQGDEQTSTYAGYDPTKSFKQNQMAIEKRDTISLEIIRDMSEKIKQAKQDLPESDTKKASVQGFNALDNRMAELEQEARDSFKEYTQAKKAGAPDSEINQKKEQWDRARQSVAEQEAKEKFQKYQKERKATTSEMHELNESLQEIDAQLDANYRAYQQATDPDKRAELEKEQAILTKEKEGIVQAKDNLESRTQSSKDSWQRSRNIVSSIDEQYQKKAKAETDEGKRAPSENETQTNDAEDSKSKPERAPSENGSTESSVESHKKSVLEKMGHRLARLRESARKNIPGFAAYTDWVNRGTTTQKLAKRILVSGTIGALTGGAVVGAGVAAARIATSFAAGAGAGMIHKKVTAKKLERKEHAAEIAKNRKHEMLDSEKEIYAENPIGSGDLESVTFGDRDEIRHLRALKESGHISTQEEKRLNQIEQMRKKRAESLVQLRSRARKLREDYQSALAKNEKWNAAISAAAGLATGAAFSLSGLVGGLGESMDAGDVGVDDTTAPETSGDAVESKPEASEIESTDPEEKKVPTELDAQPNETFDIEKKKHIIPEAAKIRTGEGITYALKRQIDANPDLQAALGISGEASPHDMLRIAKDFGYINDAGSMQVGVYDGQGAAYEMVLDDSGKVIVNEYQNGSFVERHMSGTSFEGLDVDAPAEFLSETKSSSSAEAASDATETTSTTANTNAAEIPGTTISPESGSSTPELTRSYIGESVLSKEPLPNRVYPGSFILNNGALGEKFGYMLNDQPLNELFVENDVPLTGETLEKAGFRLIEDPFERARTGKSFYNIYDGHLDRAYDFKDLYERIDFDQLKERLGQNPASVDTQNLDATTDEIPGTTVAADAQTSNDLETPVSGSETIPGQVVGAETSTQTSGGLEIPGNVIEPGFDFNSVEYAEPVQSPNGGPKFYLTPETQDMFGKYNWRMNYSGALSAPGQAPIDFRDVNMESAKIAYVDDKLHIETYDASGKILKTIQVDREGNIIN